VLFGTALVATVLGTYFASRWPELGTSLQRWKDRRDEAAAAPIIAQLNIHSDLLIRTRRASASTDPYVVSATLSAARRLLEGALRHDIPLVLDWFWPDAVHYSHIVLGRGALLAGDLPTAECRLAAAGSVSLHLSSGGPDMTLAHELLLRHRTVAVLAYLDACVGPSEHGATIASWKRVVEAGGIPEFGPVSRLDRMPNPSSHRTAYGGR